MNKQLLAVTFAALTLAGTTAEAAQYSKKQKAGMLAALVVATAATTYYFHDQIKETGNLLKEEGAKLFAEAQKSANTNIIEPVNNFDIKASLSQARSNVSNYLSHLGARIQAIFSK